GDKLAKMYPPLVLGKDAPFEACFNKSVEWPDDSGGNEAFTNAAELRKAYEEDEVAHEVIDTARRLEGLRRPHSVHAAAVVIGHEPLTNHVPVQRTDNEIVTQYEMNAVAAIGLLKMDFLGLRNLTVIEDALAHIKRNTGLDVDIDHVALDDPKTFKLLQQAMSAGVFQMDSPGMTRLLKQLRIDRFEEIAALIALYRPGPMEQIKHYVKGKHEPSSVKYYHPLLETVLKDTNGVIVYQEQVMEMFQVVAGFTPQEADMVRAAISKKISKELVKWKDQFEKGCAATGLNQQEAQGLWDLILPFAGYSFNRAHAFGYGLVAYQTAWLKANYLTEYMGALLTSVKDDKDQMTFYLSESRGMGINVRPPSVNESDMDFTPKNNDVLFGLSAIRNVGEMVSEKIIKARESGEEFSGFHDFCKRVDASCLNKKVIEALAKAGAFDCLGVSRGALLAPGPEGNLVMCEQVGRLIEGVIAERRSEDAGQFSLFAGAAKEDAPRVDANFDSALVGIEIERSDLLAAEKEMLGLYVSEHPLSNVAAALRYQTEAEVLDLKQGPDGAIKSVGGILSGLVRKFTKKGDVWYQGVLEDIHGSVDVVFWPQTVQATASELLIDDQIVIIKGRIELRDEHCKLIALEIRKPKLDGANAPLRIRMSAQGCTPDRLESLKGVLSEHPGSSPVLLHLESSARTTVLKLGGFSVELRNGLFAEIKAVLGPEALVN
ncbi:MAG: DNA polymerase III subunit alpha, partial [Actinomycetota bacterium]